MADNKGSSSRPSFPREKLIRFEQALKQVKQKKFIELADIAYLMRLLMDIPKPYRPPVREDLMEDLKNQVCRPTAPINDLLDDIFPSAPLSGHFPNASRPNEGEESEITRNWHVMGCGGDTGEDKEEEEEEEKK